MQEFSPIGMMERGRKDGSSTESLGIRSSKKTPFQDK
jgi:hypothetical protein